VKFTNYFSIINNRPELRKEVGGVSQVLSMDEMDAAVTMLNEASWRILSKELPPDNSVVFVLVIHEDAKGYDVGVAQHSTLGLFADHNGKILPVFQWMPIIPAEWQHEP
jgi:hypothetical protein